MRRHRERSGCSVEAHHGRLRLRFRWWGRRVAKSTELPDTPEHRAQLEKLARLIAATIAAGQDPLVLLDKASAPSPSQSAGPTVAEYFETWMTDKVPPIVRKAQARDYRRHIAGYVLSRLGRIPIVQLSARDILGLRAELLRRGRSLKSVKNILAGSFKAMIRDAREIDGLLDRDPFVGIRWGRVPVPPPDPFSADEARRITSWFERKRFGFHSGRTTESDRLRVHPPYHALVHVLFWTGMRPSEAAGLRWSDVDLDRRVLRVVRSRHLLL